MGIFSEHPFFKKAVQSVPLDWEEQTPDHLYIIHHILFGYANSCTVPGGYADVFSEEEVQSVMKKARDVVESLNLNVSNATAVNRIIELKAARLFYDKLLERHQANLLQAYRLHSDVIHQRDEMESFLQLRKSQLETLQNQIDSLTNS